MTEAESKPTEDAVSTNAESTVDSSETNNEAAASEATFEEKVQAEMEKAKGLKIGEMKLKLQSKGILTSTFCEKSEFVRAFAEIVVKDAERSAVVVEDVEDDEGADSRFAALALNQGDDDDSSEQDIMALPECVKHRVDKLKELDEEREKIMKEYLVERAKLEAKYHASTKPLYKKRTDIILGKMDEEIAKEHEGEGSEEGDKTKGIPQFWVCAIGHMPVVAEIITEPDADCLEYLQDITCDDDENGEGFTLGFHFVENDYFENPVLTKRYEVPNLLLADEPILKNVEGCEIKWKPEKSLLFSEVTKQQRGKGNNAGQIRAVTKKERIESFFHFFTPPEMPSMDEMNEQEADRLEVAFNMDYDIAQAIRSHIIPKAVLWFSGHAMEQEMETAMQGMKWPADGSAPGGDETPECKQS
jgi:nucleosome assembly protein 1-like 1